MPSAHFFRSTGCVQAIGPLDSITLARTYFSFPRNLYTAGFVIDSLKTFPPAPMNCVRYLKSLTALIVIVIARLSTV